MDMSKDMIRMLNRNEAKHQLEELHWDAHGKPCHVCGLMTTELTILHRYVAHPTLKERLRPLWRRKMIGLVREHSERLAREKEEFEQELYGELNNG